MTPVAGRSLRNLKKFFIACGDFRDPPKITFKTSMKITSRGYFHACFEVTVGVKIITGSCYS